MLFIWVAGLKLVSTPSSHCSCSRCKRNTLPAFFFSSIRRHTIWTGDWSSDVCSSDLVPGTAPASLTLIRPIGDGGGWAELTFLATQRNVFYVGASTDDPKNRELLPGTTRQKNSFV